MPRPLLVGLAHPEMGLKVGWEGVQPCPNAPASPQQDSVWTL